MTYFLNVLREGTVPLLLKNGPDYPEIETITPGVARGKLLGGNLSVFVTLLGSIYFPDLAERGPTILFVEGTALSLTLLPSQE